MRTSTAAENDFRCPKCGDELAQDRVGRGFVRHKNNPDCDFEKGERNRDETEPE